MTSYQYRKSHCGDKTILRPSYLHNGISYTDKTTSLYWIGAQKVTIPIFRLVLQNFALRCGFPYILRYFYYFSLFSSGLAAMYYAKWWPLCPRFDVLMQFSVKQSSIIKWTMKKTPVILQSVWVHFCNTTVKWLSNVWQATTSGYSEIGTMANYEFIDLWCR